MKQCRTAVKPSPIKRYRLPKKRLLYETYQGVCSGGYCGSMTLEAKEIFVVLEFTDCYYHILAGTQEGWIYVERRTNLQDFEVATS